jgi:transcriptional regulator of aromatic amino acid metabolism
MNIQVTKADNASNGTILTEYEKTLIDLGDVVDLNGLRDIPALRERQQKVGLLGRHRLQKQIDELEKAIPVIDVECTEVK